MKVELKFGDFDFELMNVSIKKDDLLIANLSGNATVDDVIVLKKALESGLAKHGFDNLVLVFCGDVDLKAIPLEQAKVVLEHIVKKDKEG